MDSERARRWSLRARSGLGTLLLSLATATGTRADPLTWQHGDTRVHVGGTLSTWNVFRLDPDTPSERPSSVLAARLVADQGRRFHFVLAGRFGYDGKIGNPDRGNPWLDMDEVYQDKDIFVGLDEAYVEMVFHSLEIRIGKQKVSWGRLDEIQPTDNLNPEDLTEVLFVPELERKIGVPGISVTGYAYGWKAEAVWTPWSTAMRLPHRDDRWFPPLLEVADTAVTPLGTIPVHAHYPDVHEPPHTLASSDAALRVGRSVGPAELSASVFHGWDKTATFGASGTATVTPTGLVEAPAAPEVDVRIRPTLHRVTIVGGDLAVPLWFFAIRAEAAWIHGRAFPLLLRDQVNDPRLLAVVGAAVQRVAQTGVTETVALPLTPIELERDAVQWGIGFDYTLPGPLTRLIPGGDVLAGTFVLVQLLETIIPDHDPRFIDDQVENVLGLTVRQSFRDERLTAELKVAYNPGHGDYYVWPQLTYRVTGNLHALFEARVLGGSATSTIGQYRHNDGIKIGLRYFF